MMTMITSLTLALTALAETPAAEEPGSNAKPAAAPALTGAEQRAVDTAGTARLDAGGGRFALLSSLTELKDPRLTARFNCDACHAPATSMLDTLARSCSVCVNLAQPVDPIRDRLGLVLAPVPEVLKRHLKLTGNDARLVTEVEAGPEVGLRRDDVLLRLEDQPPEQALVEVATRASAAGTGDQPGNASLTLTPTRVNVRLATVKALRAQLVREGQPLQIAVRLKTTTPTAPLQEASRSAASSPKAIDTPSAKAPSSNPEATRITNPTVAKEYLWSGRLFTEKSSAPHFLVQDSTPAWRVGLSLGDLDGTLRAQLDIPADRGAVVTQVVAKSPAEAAGFKEHDIVVEADGKPLPNHAAFAELVRTKKGEAFDIKLIRRGKPLSIRVAAVQDKVTPGWVEARLTPDRQAVVLLDVDPSGTPDVHQRFLLSEVFSSARPSQETLALNGYRTVTIVDQASDPKARLEAALRKLDETRAELTAIQAELTRSTSATGNAAAKETGKPAPAKPSDGQPRK